MTVLLMLLYYYQGQVTTPLMQSLPHRKILKCVKKCNTIQSSLKRHCGYKNADVYYVYI